MADNPASHKRSGPIWSYAEKRTQLRQLSYIRLIANLLDTYIGISSY